MELINTLKESQRLRSGGRRAWRKYGTSNDAEITQPFGQAIKMIQVRTSLPMLR